MPFTSNSGDAFQGTGLCPAREPDPGRDHKRRSGKGDYGARGDTGPERKRNSERPHPPLDGDARADESEEHQGRRKVHSSSAIFALRLAHQAGLRLNRPQADCYRSTI